MPLFFVESLIDDKEPRIVDRNPRIAMSFARIDDRNPLIDDTKPLIARATIKKLHNETAHSKSNYKETTQQKPLIARPTH